MMSGMAFAPCFRGVSAGNAIFVAKAGGDGLAKLSWED